MSEEIAQIPEELLPYRGESWDELTAQAQQVQGADHVKGDVLEGIPFCLTSLTLREGDYVHAGCGKPHPYMFCEAVIAPEEELRKAVARGRVTEEAARNVDPGEALGFIEAGTGLYRQILAYLESEDYVTLPEGSPDGHFGESRFDSLPAAWDFRKGDVRFAENGEPVWKANIRLVFPRGLRISEYENEYTKQGHTRYAG